MIMAHHHTSVRLVCEIAYLSPCCNTYPLTKACSLVQIQPASSRLGSCKEGHSTASSPLSTPSPFLTTSSRASVASSNHTNSTSPTSSTSASAVCSNHTKSAREPAFAIPPLIRRTGRRFGKRIKVACLFCREWKIQCRPADDPEEMCQ